MSWTEVLQKITTILQPNGQPDMDRVRSEYIHSLVDRTHRPLIIYASGFLNPQSSLMPGHLFMLSAEDKEGLIEVIRKIDVPEIDILLHSPGGQAEAAESFVHILRNKYTNIRFIIPMIGKSAATMLAMSGDFILMDVQSELGPIDPQFLISRPDGTGISVPAQAIIDQFKEAQNQITSNPQLLSAWLPILQQMGPALIQQAQTAIDLSKELVENWLTTYMFKGAPDAQAKAASIAEYLSNHNNFRSHGRVVDLARIRQAPALLPLKILDTQSDAILQERIRDLYHAISFTFNAGVVKLFENSAGLRVVRAVQLRVAQGAPVP